MSYFKRASDAIIDKQLEFGNISTNSIQKFSCKNGDIAGWGVIYLDDLLVSKVYDCSTGTPVHIGNVSVLPGIDLCGGYFSSGCFPSGDIFLDETVFYKIDYV